MPVQRLWTVSGASCLIAAVSACLIFSGLAHAQLGGGGGTGVGGNNFFGIVGGVTIDAQGVLSGDTVRMTDQLRSQTLAMMQQAGGLDQARPGTRSISLKRLDVALRDAIADKQDLPLDVLCLGGLQKIESVVLVPEANDILIVGQGDGWKLDENGLIVGANNGLPMIQLQDLIVALRTADAANEGPGVSVSIDPTAEGVEAYQKLLSQMNGFDPAVASNLENAMGQQTVTVTGVPVTSRFAQVLVNADYRMKRLSMGLDKARIQNFPSVLEMIQQKNATFGRMSPRFWMECNYEPVKRSEDGMIWQIHGQGVKTLTQEQFFDADGKRKQSDRKNGFAEKWAENMNERFGELLAAEPAFAELRNIMDLSVVAALIRKHDLAMEANADLPNLMGTLTSVSLPEFPAPRTVSTQCSFVRTTNSWAVTASGGVQIDSWKVASNVVVEPGLTRASLALPTMVADRVWSAAN